ncbi:MAG: hypothetical protein MUC43_13080 [Pirellula sp.]|jgi:hypothetical protein|nr:hypothetical protein [Pirellula sp.]
MLRFLFTICTFAALTCQVANAGLVITIGNFDKDGRATMSSFQAGELVTLGLYIHNSSGANLSVDEFTFGFDVSLPGASDFYDGNNSSALESLFSDFAIESVANVNSDIDNVVFSSSELTLGYDVLVDFSIITSSINFTSGGDQNSAVRMANISFRTAADTPVGTYGFKFNPNATDLNGSRINFVTGDLPLAAGLDGSSFNRFEMSAVPEPSSLALGASVLFVLGSIRRFRRRNAEGKTLE